MPPHAEAVRGALAARAIERFGVDAGRLHVDLTALRMTGAYEDSALVAKGWAQGQGVDLQVRALQASSADGVSLYLRPDPGSAAELTVIGSSLERLRSLAESNAGGPALLVCDSAIGQPKTLCEIPRGAFLHRPPQGDDRVAGALPERGRARRAAPARLRLRARAQAAPIRAHPLPRRAPRLESLRPPSPARPTHSVSPTSTPPRRSARSARPASGRSAGEQLGRVRNGLGGPHYKAKGQVDRRVAQILTD